MLSYIRNRALVRSHAHQMVTDIGESLPPTASLDLQRTTSRNRAVRVVRKISADAKGFAQANDLGFLSRARLANKFQWRLRELNYSDEFIDMATVAVTISLSGSFEPQEYAHPSGRR